MVFVCGEEGIKKRKEKEEVLPSPSFLLLLSSPFSFSVDL